MKIKTPISFLVLISFAVVFASCGEEKVATLTVPPNAEAGDLQLDPDTYIARELEYSAESGTFMVPENRDDPNSRLIALPITRVHATGNSAMEPIFFLNGGPGITNMGFSHVEDLILKHDIVMVGFRGVDGSVVMDCPEVDVFFGDPPGDFIEQSVLDVMAEAYAACAARLQSEGVDTDGYNLIEVVQDMEDARLALGYERVNLISQSYGTRLAMIYAWMYPNSVYRSAMISVNPPGHFVWFPEVIDDQLAYYAELCKKDEACSARTDNLAESIRSAINEMPASWMFFPIKKGNALMGTFMMLYHTDSSKDVFDAWLAAEQGDWSGIAMLSMAIDFMVQGASVWGESAAKAMSSDYIFEPGGDPLADLMPPGSIIGAPGSILGIAGAKGWPAKIIPDSLRQVISSDVETLLISGSVDFSTPARFARDELLPFLPNGHQVILSEFGHTGDIWWKQREATLHLLSTFYDTGIVDDSLFEYEEMQFEVGLGYPGMMKLGLAGIVAVLMALLAIIWYVVKRRSQKKALKA